MKDKKNRVINLQWHITNRCNNRCKHCYHDSYEGEEFTLDELKKTFKDFLLLAKKNNKKPKLTITGGEPFIREDFVDFLEYLSEYKAELDSCYILTNGSLLTDSLIEEVKKRAPVVSGMQISIEGDKSVNDAIRGKGSFEKILKALTLLKKHKIPVHLAVTISKKNHKKIFDLLDLLLIYDTPLFLRRFVPIGFGGEKISEIMTAQETKIFFKKVNEINSKNKLLCGKDVFSTSKVCTGSIQAQDWPDKVIMTCGVRKKGIIVVMPDGEVYPCRLVPESIGNVKKKSLGEIYNSTYNKFVKVDKKNMGCESCDAWEKCKGGAACISLAVKGDFFAKDPQCWKK